MVYVSEVDIISLQIHCGGEEIQNACCIEQQNSIDEPEKKKKHDPMNDRSLVRV